jgi:hypothetical protein
MAIVAAMACNFLLPNTKAAVSPESIDGAALPEVVLPPLPSGVARTDCRCGPRGAPCKTQARSR